MVKLMNSKYGVHIVFAWCDCICNKIITVCFVILSVRIAMYDKSETLERLRLQYGWQVNNITLERTRNEIQTILAEIDQFSGEGRLMLKILYHQKIKYYQI